MLSLLGDRNLFKGVASCKGLRAVSASHIDARNLHFYTEDHYVRYTRTTGTDPEHARIVVLLNLL